MRSWTEFEPEDVVGMSGDSLALIEKPRNEMGEECPWPWEPQQLVGVPLGQYHCPYCGAMVLAGVPHIDYTDFDEDYLMYMRGQLHQLAHTDDYVSEYVEALLDPDDVSW